MSLPTLNKTWQFSVNQTALGQGSANASAAQLALTIKNSLKGFSNNPWVVRYSSNASGTTGSPTGTVGTVGDGIDHWTTQADINTGGSNSRHAWMVMRQTGIATNFEMCWDFQSTSTLNTCAISVSPSAGFTGGSATAAPTATDQVFVLGSINSQGTWSSGIDTTHQAQVMQSTDGYCTRIIAYRGTATTTNLCTYWSMERPQNVVSGWINPSVTTFIGATSGIAPTYSNLSINGISDGYNPIVVGTFTIKYSGEGSGNNTNTGGLLVNNTSDNVGLVSNDFDGTWPFYPVGIYSTTGLCRGKLGNLFDLWWAPVGLNNGDTFPISSATRQFVVMGPLIFPWTNDGTIPLLA